MIGEVHGKVVVPLLLTASLLLCTYVAWRWGDGVFPRVEAASGTGGVSDERMAGEVSPRAARAAEARIRAFHESAEAELRLESFEVSSLLHYSLNGLLPRGVIRPRVDMGGDLIHIRASVLPRALPGLPDLGGIAGILPDTVPVVVQGSLSPFGGGSMLIVRSIEVQGVPIPATAFPDILVALGRRETRGLPASAMLVPSFGRIRGAYIEDGELVLVRT